MKLDCALPPMPSLLTNVVLLCMGLVVLFPAQALACGVLDSEGEARRASHQSQWLREETDLKVRGTFVADADTPPVGEGDTDYSDETEGRSGTVIAADGRHYRLFIPFVINCGFPNYGVYDGSKGLFYLKRDEEPFESDEEDLSDGVIENFNFIHFRSGRGK